MAETTGLLNLRTFYRVPRVRIPPPPQANDGPAYESKRGFLHSDGESLLSEDEGKKPQARGASRGHRLGLTLPTWGCTRGAAESNPSPLGLLAHAAQPEHHEHRIQVKNLGQRNSENISHRCREPHGNGTPERNSNNGLCDT